MYCVCIKTCGVWWVLCRADSEDHGLDILSQAGIPAECGCVRRVGQRIRDARRLRDIEPEVEDYAPAPERQAISLLGSLGVTGVLVLPGEDEDSPEILLLGGGDVKALDWSEGRYTQRTIGALLSWFTAIAGRGANKEESEVNCGS